jgi:hypothetical protein
MTEVSRSVRKHLAEVFKMWQLTVILSPTLCAVNNLDAVIIPSEIDFR